ncbi:MAG: class I SAM-dependent methyltransferase [Betaproteobacteria bacterium]|nr:class I SAM-dependent methyltransferase [Betaproteobacteria bacterium]
MSAVDEMLAESAALARSIAGEHCRQDPESGESCSWYHGLWQELRLMDLAASPCKQSDFFPLALEQLRYGRNSLRILISGAADHAILAQVLHACRACNINANITVVDICDTPLRLNQWYADKENIQIQTMTSDILDYSPEKSFDVICSHSFLGQFDAARRARIVEHWRQLLAPDGGVLTINRIRPETLRDPVTFSEQQTQDFLATISARSNRSGAELAGLLERARLYAQRLHAYAISESGISSLFTDKGYRMTHQSVMKSAGSATGKMRGLAIPADAQHAGIVAVATP